jgi:hypothetical protein
MLLVPLLAAVTLSLSDTTSVDVRSRPELHDVALDLNTFPGADLAVSAKRSSFGVGYRPRLGWVDVTRDRDFIVQHSAGAGYAWSTPRLRLTLSVSGSYGHTTFLNAAQAATPAQAIGADSGAGAPSTGQGEPAPAGPAGGLTGMQGQSAQPTQPLPQVSVLQVGSAAAGMSASYDFSRRWSAGLGISYSLGGGLGDSAQYLPFRYGPSAGANVGYQLTKQDSLGSAVGAGLDILPDRGARFYTISVLESWSHRFDALTVGSVGAGASYLQARPGAHLPRTRSVNSAGTVAFSRGFRLDGGAQLGLSANAVLGTNYNPLLGTVAQSLAGGLSAGWVRKRLAFSAGINGSHTLPFDDPDAFRAYGASVGASYLLTPLVSLHAGAYWAHQVLPQAALLTDLDPNRWGGSLSISVAAPPIKF